MITRRSFLRSMLAAPAIVAVTNIMPVRSIERFIRPPARTLFIHPRLFDDLIGYIEQAKKDIVAVSGFTPEMMGELGMVHTVRYEEDYIPGDLQLQVVDGTLTIDWPGENARIVRASFLPNNSEVPMLSLPRPFDFDLQYDYDPRDREKALAEYRADNARFVSDARRRLVRRS